MVPSRQINRISRVLGTAMLLSSLWAAGFPSAEELISKNEREELQDIIQHMPPDERMVILRDLSLRYYRSGKFDKGLDYATRALDVAKTAYPQSDPRYIEAHHTIASLLAEVGQYAQSGSMREEAYRLAAKHLPRGDFVRLAVMNGLAVHYSLLQRFADAEPLFEEVLRECLEHLPSHDEYTLGAKINLSGLYVDTGRSAEAIMLLEQAIDELDKVDLGNSQNALVGRMLLGSAYLAVDRASDAINVLDDTLERTRRTYRESHPITLRAANSLAYALTKSGALDRAYDLFVNVAAGAASVFGEDHPNTLTTQLSIVHLLLLQGKSDPAVERLTEVGSLFLRWTKAQLIETAGTSLRNQLIVRQATYPDVAISTALRFDGAAAANLAANAILQWKQLQGAQDSILARFIATSDDARVRQAAEELAIQRNRLAVSLRRGQADSSKLLASVEQAEHKLAALSKDFARIDKANRVGLSDVVAALPAHAGLLEFRLYRPIGANGSFAGDRRLVGMVVRPDTGVVVKDLGLHSEIEEKVIEATNFDAPAARRIASKWLADRVITPFQEQLGSLKVIYIAPDGALNLLPLEMLPFQGVDYWIKSQELRFVSTGRSLATDRIHHESRGLAVIGSVNFGRASPDLVEATTSPGATGLPMQFAALPDTGPEAQFVADIWKTATGEASTILRDTAAREAAVKSLVPPPRILHFATHGFFLPQTQRENGGAMLSSGIALAGANAGMRGILDADDQDGILWALEAMSLNLSGTQLVAMSACDTARGIVDAFEGVYGLSRGFQIAGAQNVLMTLWSLNDSRARAFMQDFYAEWAKSGASNDPLEALRAVKLAWIASENPSRSDPRIWAPYVLVQQGK